MHSTHNIFLGEYYLCLFDFSVCSGMCAALLIDGHLVAATPALQKHALLAIIANRISSNLQNISVWTVICICLSTRFPFSLKIATV